MKKGIAVSFGYAVGKAFIKENQEMVLDQHQILDAESEKDKLRAAVSVSVSQLEKLKKKTEKEMGEDKAQIFAAHIMLAEDPVYSSEIEELIDNKVNAQLAVSQVTDRYLELFASMEDEYMRERAADIKDVCRRIILNLSGKTMEADDYGYDTVIVAHDLTPSDTAELDKGKVIAFLTDIGGKTSHTAIMAKTLEIPAIVGLQDISRTLKNGDLVIVDGVKGEVYINPDSDLVDEYLIKKEDFLKEKEELKKLKDIKVYGKDGRKIEIAGNIGSPADVAKVIENGGEAVGLFRTEFLYMNSSKFPTEEEQFNAYKSVVEKMGEKPVVIRTLDIGGDKELPYLDIEKEMNPFLGYRAIRLCLDRKDIFKVQLRALLRASAYGNLRIMFPMISGKEEILQAKEVLAECMKELKVEGIPFNEKLQVGIMVEIPAAAVNSDELADYVDFFSIGTNDLIQYTLAVDRLNQKVSYLYNPFHPAVLKLIKMTIDAAHNKGKWCGMCGEMAGDPDAIPILVSYGIDELSMSATSILKAKKIILGGK
jgi:phosphoenolpyruvate-protein phosphotransferase (PTS system enzyme I)